MDVESKATMNISLTPELEAFVEKELQSGMYSSASEVIRAGLRLLKDEKAPRPRFMVSSMPELEDKLLVAVRQLDQGGGVPGKKAVRELRRRAKSRRRASG